MSLQRQCCQGKYQVGLLSQEGDGGGARMLGRVLIVNGKE